MSKGFLLEVVTPDRLVIHEQDVDEVSAPGYEGYFTALPEHTPYLVLLGEGILSYRKGTTWRYMAVMGGFVEVLPDKVMVLAEKSEKSEEIDLQRAKEALERAQKRLKDTTTTSTDEVDFERAQAALHRALIRLNAKKSMKY